MDPMGALSALGLDRIQNLCGSSFQFNGKDVVLEILHIGGSKQLKILAWMKSMKLHCWEEIIGFSGKPRNTNVYAMKMKD